MSWARALCLTGLFACAPQAPSFVHEHVARAPRGSVPVVAFVDFECSYCRVAHARLTQAAEQKGATLSVIYKHVPLRSHQTAAAAAAAQICADEQGRGPQMVEALFADRGHDLQRLLAAAAQLDLHEERFVTCMSSDATKARLAADRRQFIDEQYDGVPVIFVGEHKLDGAQPMAEYAKAIARAQNR